MPKNTNSATFLDWDSNFWVMKIDWGQNIKLGVGNMLSEGKILNFQQIFGQFYNNFKDINPSGISGAVTEQTGDTYTNHKFPSS